MLFCYEIICNSNQKHRRINIMNHRAETLVIGAGAVGICCAFYLYKLGKHVAVVEKGNICAGSSYGNAGLIVPSHSIPLAAPGVISQGLKWMFDPASPFYIKPRFQSALFSWLWKFRGACNRQHVHRSIPILRDLSLASLDLFDELATIEGRGFGFEKNGVLELFNTAKGFDHGVENARLMQQHKLQNQLIQKDELKKYIGDMRTTAIGGVYFPQDAQLIPDRFVHQLAGHIEKKGVHLHTSVEVLGFETDGREVTAVKTTRGDIAVKEVILAGGTWSSEIARDLQLKIWIEPAKGYSVTFNRPATYPQTPLNFAEAKVLSTPMDDTLRFSGTLELAGFNESINLRRVQAILKAVRKYFPDMDPDSLELLEIWRGLRPCSPDGLPYLGRAPRYDNVIIATGHGMLGISLAPVTGKIVSQLSANEKPAVNIEALSIERFNRI
jgi:D-amino-acid dehydrogenase